jgi:hypothetical protein
MCKGLKGINSSLFQNILSTFAWKELRKRNFCQIANKSKTFEISIATPECKLGLYHYMSLPTCGLLC